MNTAPARKLYLCADLGGTAIKVTVINEVGEMGSSSAGPSNIKSVGAEGALRNILKTAFQALQNLPQPLLVPVDKVAPLDPELELHLGIFERVWLGVAGILRQSEIDEFRPFAAKAFGFELDDDRLRITNDGHLLAAPSVSLPHIESTVVLVAGTGSVSLAFKKEGSDLMLKALSGGWGWLIGDEGSAFCVGRLAMRRLMFAADDQNSRSLQQSSDATINSLLPIFNTLLERLHCSDPANMIDKIYSDQSTSTSTPSNADNRRKLWIADASRVVFRYAFEDSTVDKQSQELALSILEEAIQPLVDATRRLLRYDIVVSKSSLSLGGGLFNSIEYKDMLIRKLRENGIEFSHVAVVKSAAEEGAKALLAMHREVEIS